jgi:hypothetical protein
MGQGSDVGGDVDTFAPLLLWRPAGCDMDEWVSQVPNVLRHPFLLAVVTAFFVNGVTRTWQDRQKAFEVATGLVAEMSEATTKALLAADRASRVLCPPELDSSQSPTIRPPTRRGDEYRKYVDELWRAREEWERSSGVLGTKLEAYYPSARKGQPPIAREWTSFRRQVTSWMPDGGAGVDWEKWPAEQETLYATKRRLIRLVLDERPAGFDFGWLPRRNDPPRWLRRVGWWKDAHASELEARGK